MVSPRILLAYPATVALYLAVWFVLARVGLRTLAEQFHGYFSIVHMAALTIPLVVLLVGTVFDTCADGARWVRARVRDGAKKRQ